MKQIWMWTEDERDGWVGDHATKEKAIEEMRLVAMTLGACLDDDVVFLVAPVDADEMEEDKELVFLGPKEKVTLESLVAS